MIKQIINILIVVLLVGCGGNTRNDIMGSVNNSPAYDVYLCASIRVASSSGATYASGIYAANYDSLDEFTKIIDLDGDNNLIDNFTLDSQGNIYWTNRLKHGIFKSNPDGTHIRQIVSGLSTPWGLAIDEKRARIYWSDWLTDTNSGNIAYASLEGQDKKIIVTEGLRSGGHILIDSKNDILYISDLFGHRILKTTMEGGTVEKISDANQPSQLALDYNNNNLLWADIAGDSISSVNLDDFSKKDIVVFDDAFANPDALAINKTRDKILFVSGVGGEEKLQSANLEGGNIETINTSMPHAVQALWVAK